MAEWLKALFCNTLKPGFDSHQCFYTCASKWIEKARLSGWPSRGQQVLLYLGNSGLLSPEVQIKGISDPIERTCVILKTILKNGLYIALHRSKGKYFFEKLTEEGLQSIQSL